eukprot:6175677-Pleurochrysis_carterae.AAC.3
MCQRRVESVDSCGPPRRDARELVETRTALSLQRGTGVPIACAQDCEASHEREAGLEEYAQS